MSIILSDFFHSVIVVLLGFLSHEVFITYTLTLNVFAHLLKFSLCGVIIFKFKLGVGLGCIRFNFRYIFIQCCLFTCYFASCPLLDGGAYFPGVYLLLSSFHVHLSVCCRSGALSDKL